MIKPAWLRTTFNKDRSAGTFGNISRVTDTPEGDEVWHSWDFELEPGIYSLNYVSRHSRWGNYFAIGTVSYPNQVTPMKPDDRFGELVYIPSSPTMNISSLLHPVSFTVQEGTVVRIESWACYTGRTNSTPLPDGLVNWRSFKIQLLEDLGDGPAVCQIVKVKSDRFGVDFQSVSKRKFTDTSILFGAEDSGDTDFNDLIVELKQVSNGADSTFLEPDLSGFKSQVPAVNKIIPSINKFKETTPPSWVIRDHTLALIKALKTMKFAEIPTGEINEFQAKRMLNIFYEAKLEFKVHVAYYDHYVPVFVFVPFPQDAFTPPLPASCRVQLTEEDFRQASVLHDRFSSLPETRTAERAYENNSRKAQWELTQIVFGRIQMYKDVLEAGWDVTKLGKSLSLGFIGTFFDIAGMYVDHSGINDPLTKMLISCPAFILSASTTSLSSFSGIGLIGLISTIQLYGECAESINELVAQNLRHRLEEESRVKQLAKTVSSSRDAVSYDRERGRLTIHREDGSVEDINVSNPNESTIDVHAGTHEGYVEVTVRQYSDGDMRCMDYHKHEEFADGTFRDYRVEHYCIPDTGEDGFDPPPLD